MFSDKLPSRRDFLRGAAAFGGTLVAAMTTGCEPGHLHSEVRTPIPQPEDLARATTTALADVPVVDRLVVHVVVDGALDPGAATSRAGGTLVERPDTLLDARGRRALKKEWGLALHIESRRADEQRRVLLDFGNTPGVYLNNLRILNVDLAVIDALILSHGHDDHFGGLVPLLQRDQTGLRSQLPLYIGGEDTFCGRENYVLDRPALTSANARIVMAEQPAIPGGHAFTTGQIPRPSFEQVFPSDPIKLGMRDGIGCDVGHFSPAEQQGNVVPDLFRGEFATCFNVRDRGLVVIGSCCHAGVVNTVRRAQALSGVRHVHAVMGGFHLFQAAESYVRETVEALQEIAPDHIIPMHCTGADFSRQVHAALPGKLVESYVGTRYTFGV